MVGVGARNGVTTIGAILFFPSAVKETGNGSGEAVLIATAIGDGEDIAAARLIGISWCISVTGGATGDCRAEGFA